MPNSEQDKLVREKLIARGIQSLNDAELLSLIIESNNNNSSLSTATEILKKYNGNLGELGNQNLKNLRLNQGLGIKNSASILSAIELGRRISAQITTKISTIETNQDIYKIFRPKLAHLDHEEFWVLYLSASNGILDNIKISQGGITSINVDHKIIIKRAVELLACGIIVVHNHPSGNPTPSEKDIELTRKLKLGASLFEINLLDHVIITSTKNVSLKQLGLF